MEKDTESKIRNIKIIREIENLFFKPIITPIEGIDISEEKQMMTERPLVKNTWYNWLLNYIPKPIKIQLG